jgi:TPR repeat protein
MALYSLNYNPNTFLPNRSFKSMSGLLSKSEAFSILLNLANQENLPEACNWIAQCYQDGQGVSQDLSLSLKWRSRASEEVNDINQ